MHDLFLGKKEAFDAKQWIQSSEDTHTSYRMLLISDDI
jgi:hypothetical protein